MSIFCRIAGACVGVIIAALQFQSVSDHPSKHLVIGLAITLVVLIIGGESFSYWERQKDKRDQVQRDEELIKTTVQKLKEDDKAKSDAAYGQITNVTNLRREAEQTPILKAHFIRSHLMPRSPYQEFMGQIFGVMGRTEYNVDCDFLYEIYLVNTTDNLVTVRSFTAEVRDGEEWKKLKMIEDLSDYQIRTGEDPHSPRNNLISLAQTTKNVPLARGVGYRGWLRFEYATEHKKLEGKVYTCVRIIDALGGIHEVSNSEPLDTSEGALMHNPTKDL